MTKLAIYRDNTAYAQFLAPALAGRKDFEVQVFPVGTSENHITAWITEHADRIRSMDRVYLDQTSYEAGKSLPSAERSDLKHWSIWSDIKTNYGQLDRDFQQAAQVVVTGATNEATITEIVRHLLQKETPTKVYVVAAHMEDHNLFGLGYPENKQDAERLEQCLRKVTRQPVYYLHVDDYGVDTYVPVTAEDIVWVFIDRHFKGSKKSAFRKIPPAFKLFEVPIENLIQDALRFGIELDVEAYAEAIRGIVAAW